MNLHLYDTKSKTKKSLAPQEQRISLYVCGPTVYDRAHLGNARSVVVFDTLFRLLTHAYPDVCYVRNITDIDDKIIQAAHYNQESIHDLTQRTLGFFHHDMDALHAWRPTHEPRATDHVQDMIHLISTLIDKGYAYIVADHVMFHVKHMSHYGSLSGRSLDTQQAGARVAVDAHKRDPHDFVLWKPSHDGEPGWESPWGWGRPGWHIECSAMSHAFLPLPLTIHGGGQDLIFPHHENEQAQSCCGFDVPELAHIWMHNGILTVDGVKMAKSLNNFITVSDALKRWPGEVIRWVLLSAHYRQPLDWTESKLAQAKKNLDRLYEALTYISDKEPADPPQPPQPILSALYDDLNTPQAFKALFAQVNAVNQAADSDERTRRAQDVLASARLMGFAHHTPQAWFQGKTTSKSLESHALSAQEIEQHIEDREKARRYKDFTKADAVRQHLESQGIILEDRHGKTTWKRR
ncbi:cysteine--tRNA ligase [Candidatus Hepatobacter penaei]|uniref:cysteine--tRNA ligase n=1 Tax=Candidatus Hepatobacter penaei TaxID=1274402 RepID=UPI0004F3DC34|nr:cysteine--tRNA ligase [Candidatus Hepatobacter penaei]